MKLVELYSDEFLYKVEESFNSKIDIIWQQEGWGEVGGFTIDDIPFIMELQKVHPNILGLPPKAKTVEVTFYRSDKDTDAGYSTTGESNNIAQFVYGIVMNAIRDKIHTYDGFYFSAERKHSIGDEYDSKVAIYTLLSRRAAKDLGLNFFISETDTSVKFLLTTHQTSDPRFKDYRKKLSEGINFVKFVRNKKL